MKISEVFRSEVKPQLVKLHYFNVTDSDAAVHYGMKRDKTGNWYLPQYNTSGSKFDQIATSLIRLFGHPRTIVLK